MEREQLQRESTLVVTVQPSAFHDDVRETIRDLQSGKDAETPPTITFESYDDLLTTLTPQVLDLIESIRRENPESINETARVVGRDVKNVHEELAHLAQVGILYFESDGQRKRPVVWFEELQINLPFERDASDAATAPS
jgi:predicted transcriptional regulator